MKRGTVLLQQQENRLGGCHCACPRGRPGNAGPKAQETREEIKRLEPHVPGNEAEMKGRHSWGKQAVRTDRQLFPGREAQGAATAALCLMSLRPGGGQCLESVTSRHSHGAAESEGL